MCRANETASSDSETAPAQYGPVAAVYDALMRGVPHGTWLSRIERAARERMKSPVSALDVACGTGLVTELLAQRGYRPVVGVDLSAEMIRIARTKASARRRQIEYVLQDAAELDLAGRSFDLIVSLFDSFNYLVEPSRLQAALTRLFVHAAPGALLAFDMNSAYALATDLFSQSETNGPVRHEWVAHWDAATRLCRVEMDFWVQSAETGDSRHFREIHLQRAYELEEVLQMLQAAGFVRIETFGNYGDRPPARRSDRWLFVAERE